MKRFSIALLVCISITPAFAQLTAEQKDADFRVLAGLYAKQYAPYEWKRQVFGVELLDIRPWLDRVAKTKDDLDFYEICVEYVAGLNDTHDSFSLPSDFVASLGFTVDLYEGSVLIDSVNRTRLPLRDYPFDIGDELVSVDGRDVELLLQEFSKYARHGNVRSTRRTAASRIVTRTQSRMPHATDVGESAKLVVHRQNGAIESYTAPWIKTGTPLRVGPVPSPKAALAKFAAAEHQAEPDYMQALRELQYSGVSEPYGVLGNASRTPTFGLPANFVQRLGRVAGDFFYSGTYEAGGFKIGYIRIPTYSVASITAPLPQFEDEIGYFQQNTDGLIIDEMRNNGGLLCYGENIAARLIPYSFRPIGYELRVGWQRVNSFYNSLTAARSQGAEQWVIDLYEGLFKEISAAYRENRGRTGAVPLCSPSMERLPATDRDGKTIAYTKPIMMLVDEFSLSTADSVPAMFQDAGRGPIFGYRTMGAGGTNVVVSAGAFSEGASGMTVGLMTRKNPIVTQDYPTASYIENIGVRPDIESDYMTKQNLLQRGRPFVDAFTAAMVEHIKSKR